MATALEDLPEDTLAMSVARALAMANETASARGMDTAQYVITISEESPPPQRVWRIHYGPRDYISRRGGDLYVLVDENQGCVQRVLRGQ